MAVMKISFSPSYRDYPLSLYRAGDVLYLNGEQFDFSNLPEGATLPPGAVNSEWFKGEVTRMNGELEFTLILPHGLNAPESTRFPQAITLFGDGTVQLPPYNIEVENADRLEPDGDSGDEGAAADTSLGGQGDPANPEPQTGS
ncbi:hypothetical protein PAGU2196_11820 [Pseudomonas sp. PAGU 2196]|nr:hypothetical protein PAGU2196_11820 [Pseudomonas sp. PAGU 2196]